MAGEKRWIKNIYLGLKGMNLSDIFHSSSWARLRPAVTMNPRISSLVMEDLSLQTATWWKSQLIFIPYFLLGKKDMVVKNRWEIACGITAVTRQDLLLSSRLLTMHGDFVKHSGSGCRIYRCNYTKRVQWSTHTFSPCSYVKSNNYPVFTVSTSPQWNGLIWRNGSTKAAQGGFTHTSEEHNSPSSYPWFCQQMSQMKIRTAPPCTIHLVGSSLQGSVQVWTSCMDSILGPTLYLLDLKMLMHLFVDI